MLYWRRAGMAGEGTALYIYETSGRLARDKSKERKRTQRALCVVIVLSAQNEVGIWVSVCKIDV